MNWIKGTERVPARNIHNSVSYPKEVAVKWKRKQNDELVVCGEYYYSGGFYNDRENYFTVKGNIRRTERIPLSEVEWLDELN